MVKKLKKQLLLCVSRIGASSPTRCVTSGSTVVVHIADRLCEDLILSRVRYADVDDILDRRRALNEERAEDGCEHESICWFRETSILASEPQNGSLDLVGG